MSRPGETLESATVGKKRPSLKNKGISHSFDLLHAEMNHFVLAVNSC